MTMAVYDSPTGALRWRHRFDSSMPEEAIGALLCGVAQMLAHTDRHDQQPAPGNPAPAATSTLAATPGTKGCAVRAAPTDAFQPAARYSTSMAGARSTPSWPSLATSSSRAA
ncbi:hypothetical protein ABTX81_01945 [Kitasatospora sp. NPDC097605]|uniref:hypothetical protein n=1 Tax=Kitasatospora sp. NPDC097605 TaxID=3157226 RepID=UPI00332CFD4E